MISKNAINIDSTMLNLVAELDEFKGRWEMLGRLAPDTLQSLRRVATIESIGSSTRIEGVRLSDYEIELLLSNSNFKSRMRSRRRGIRRRRRTRSTSRSRRRANEDIALSWNWNNLDIKSFRSRDEEEVAGYAEAMNMVFDSWQHITLTENHIKQLHGTLLKYTSKDISHRGEYKKLSNNVEAIDADGKSIGVIFETATPFETPHLMRELVESTRRSLADRELHPLLVVAAFVVHFLAIHPFQDGNGRLSRVLTTLLLMQSGYRYVPYSSMERIIEDNKDGYYRALRQSQKGIRTATESLDAWCHFFLNSMKKQKDVLQRKVEMEQQLEKLSLLSGQMLSLAKERGRVTISDAVTLLEINRNTAKLHFRQLVESGPLLQHGPGRATWYTLGR